MRWAGAWNGVALSSWSVGGMREGWEGHDRREWCAARERQRTPGQPDPGPEQRGGPGAPPNKYNLYSNNGTVSKTQIDS